jgi:iron complex transport system permease protein
MQNKQLFITVGLCLCTLILAVLSMYVGHFEMDFMASLIETMEFIFGKRAEIGTGANVILNIRLPRTISAIIIGAALSLSGITFQTVFRNRLAAPDLLGVSTGSCVGAALCILCGCSAIYIQLGAFFCGLLTVALTYGVSIFFRNEKRFSLILSGVLVGGLMTSLLGLIKYLANQETQLPAIIYWTMGDISKITYEQLSMVVVPVFVCIVIMWMISWRLNFFSVNDESAISMGANIKILRTVCILSATLLTACAVSIAGTISWIGLAMPQVVRLFAGVNTKYTIRYSMFAGSIFLLLADIFGRIISTAEIPMSILTGIPGIAIFVLCAYLSNRTGVYGNQN